MITRPTLLIILLLLLLAGKVYSQVGIGNPNPHPSAALDVTATNRGLLIPRYATGAIANISNPAKGLMIFDSTRNAFYVYSGTGWIAVGDNLGDYNATQNIRLNGNYLSNDGGNNGLSINTAGNVTMPSVTIANGGAVSDFLIKGNNIGDVGFKKGYGGLGVNYIIATAGQFPSRPSGNSSYFTDQFIGEIRMFAGDYVPDGWLLCNGQLVTVNSNPALYTIIGNAYGGNGTTNFAVPDLRSAVPVGPGTSTGGNTWTRAQKTN